MNDTTNQISEEIPLPIPKTKPPQKQISSSPVFIGQIMGSTAVPKFIWVLSVVLIFTGYSVGQVSDDKKPVEKRWAETIDGKEVKFMTIDGIMVHETDPKKQPLPKIVTPGTRSTQEKAGTAPSDAVVLFDGTKETMDHWHGTRPKHPNNDWKLLEDGSMEAVREAGSIKSIKKFGSCQLHIEWMSPAKAEGEGQNRGNSGVFLMDTYEVQILDSYNDISTTYADGQAGALYGRSKPDFNACRKPGEWQTYDIIFTRPVFGEDGKVKRPAEFIVLHNSILIQNKTLYGGTGWDGPHAATDYKKHADEMPVQLQSHGSPVKFRNIWIRPLKD